MRPDANLYPVPAIEHVVNLPPSSSQRALHSPYFGNGTALPSVAENTWGLTTRRPFMAEPNFEGTRSSTPNKRMHPSGLATWSLTSRIARIMSIDII